jgi:Leucine-rich repeat (LRR) protein
MLRSLRLTQLPVNGVFLNFLKESPLIEDIFLYNCRISDYGIAEVTTLPDRLKSLSLVYAKLQGNSLVKLKGLSNLQTLNLNFTPVQVSLNEFPGSTSLHELLLDCKDMEYFDSRTLGKFPNLRMLSMTSTGVNCGWSAVPGLKKLRVLGLDRCDLSTTSFEFLTKLPNLQVLSLNDCQFPDGFTDDLGQLVNLRQLSLQRTKITTNEIKDLHRKLPNLSSLIEP